MYNPGEGLSLDHEILSDAEQKELVRSAQSGDREAAGELIRHFQRLVFNLARKRQSMAGVHTIDDLMQEGNRGLLIAISNFDLERKNRFSTYAQWWVQATISRFCYDNEHTISISNRHSQKLVKARYKRAQLYQEKGSEPTSQDIAAALHMEADDVALLLNACAPISLDKDPGRSRANEEEGDEFYNFIPATDDTEGTAIDAILVAQALGALKENMPPAVTSMIMDNLGFSGAPMSYPELSKKYRIPIPEVHRLVQIGLSRLRNLFS